MSEAPRWRNWSYGATFGWPLVVMVALMAIDVTVTSKVSRISEIGIVVMSCVGALAVRRDSLAAAFWAPPIVWLVAVETAGQIKVNWRIENFKTQAEHVAYALAGHAIWIGIACAASLLIVTVRRFASKP